MTDRDNLFYYLNCGALFVCGLNSYDGHKVSYVYTVLLAFFAWSTGRRWLRYFDDE